MEDRKKAFAEWLQAELDQRNWTQADLAKKADLATGTISRIMTKARGPGYEFCTEIARAFGYPQELVFRAAGILDPKPDDDPLLDEWAHIFNQAGSEEERQRLLELARFELERIKREK